MSPSALRERVEEEIGRAERHGTGLSCLLIVFDNLEEVAREHGGELREQMLEYAGRALRGELRCFDRVGRGGPEWDHLHVLLPGADGPRGEIVARRALGRLRAIKVEAEGARLALQVSVGLAAWRRDMSAQQLLALARAALERLGGPNGDNGAAPAAVADGPEREAGQPAAEGTGGAPAFGSIAGQ
ncbi:MAG TPA: diguanylate cyclase [Solirubrobacteraceae bacterium]|jgi:diguanylate cyclase (GGDEF)-like protein|nr:diguanylate cyclase [Solirubrobacteraceae bacterium]